MTPPDQDDAAKLQAKARRRWTWITIAAVGIISGATLLAVPALASDGSNGPTGPTGSSGSSDRVIVCETGIVTDGEVKTSSAVAVRAPRDTPVPDGCREG